MTRGAGRGLREGGASRWRSVVGLLVALSAAFEGCTSEARESAECLFDGDCPGLTCAAGRCRTRCTATRECPRGWRCQAADEPRVRACLPPGSDLTCAVNGDCPSGSQCAVGEGGRVCRAVCLRSGDCAAMREGSTCSSVTFLCSRPVVVPGAARDAGVDDAATDAGAEVDAAPDVVAD